jgi:hypothetical protein
MDVTKLNEEKPRRKLTWEQIVAIGRARNMGKSIANKYPEIASDYRAGMTPEKIVVDYGFIAEYGITSQRVAVDAVRYALYRLIPRDEMSKLATDHESFYGKIGNQKLRDRGIGIYSLTSQQKSEAGKKGIANVTTEERSKGGKISGKQNYELKIGFHAFTPQQRLDASRKATIARGKIPWSLDERNTFISLCNNPEYQRNLGPYKGSPNYQKISKKLAEDFGVERNAHSLQGYRFLLLRGTLSNHRRKK